MRHVIESVEAEPVETGRVFWDWIGVLLGLALVGLGSFAVLALVYWSLMRR